jgi:hypothetical protein
MSIVGHLRRVIPALAVVAALGVGSAPLLGQGKIPELHGTSFTNQPVNLPQDLQGKIGILVVGFSQGSREAVTAWGKRLATDYSDSPSVKFYELPVLAGVPKFMRGLVAGKIKNSVSDRGRPHFVPVTENEAGWRALTHYERGDDACVLVVDGQGLVVWQNQGNFSESAYGAMKEQVEKLRSANVPATR